MCNITFYLCSPYGQNSVYVCKQVDPIQTNCCRWVGLEKTQTSGSPLNQSLLWQSGNIVFVFVFLIGYFTPIGLCVFHLALLLLF